MQHTSKMHVVDCSGGRVVAGNVAAGRFELIAHLGQGSYAEVVLGRDRARGDLVVSAWNDG